MNGIPHFNNVLPVTALVVDSATGVVSFSGVADAIYVMAISGGGGSKCKLHRSESLQHSAELKSISQPEFKQFSIEKTGRVFDDGL